MEIITKFRFWLHWEVTNGYHVLHVNLSGAIYICSYNISRHKNRFPHASNISGMRSIIAKQSPCRVISKDFKKWYLQVPCLALGIRERLWRISRQVRLLCPWARHVTECPHLYVEDKWPSFPSQERVGGRKGIRP